MGKTYRDKHRAKCNQLIQPKWDRNDWNSVWDYYQSPEYLEYQKEKDRLWSLHNQDPWRYVAHCQRFYRIDGDYGLYRMKLRERIQKREIKTQLEDYYMEKTYH
jgi:hypothetical protein